MLAVNSVDGRHTYQKRRSFYVVLSTRLTAKKYVGYVWIENGMLLFHSDFYRVVTGIHQNQSIQVLGPINAHLGSIGMKGVTFEDNLSAQKTLEVLQFWKTHLTNFVDPQFVQANLTDIIQVIDRHIGVINKRGLYKAIRVELTKRLREACEAAGSANTITIKALTPREKRIVITKTIADCHAKLTHHLCKTYKRAFIATGTLVPVYHLLEVEAEGPSIETESNLPTVLSEGPSVISEDTQVSLQHLGKYNYAERITKDKVLALVKAIEKERERVHLKDEQREAANQEGRAAQTTECQPFVDKAFSLMEQLTNQVVTITKDHLDIIHQATGLEHFIIGGSWAAKQIVAAQATVCRDDDEVELIYLDANNIDVFHGTFTDDTDGKFKVEPFSLDTNHIDIFNRS